jgi:hypothetical protein
MERRCKYASGPSLTFCRMLCFSLTLTNCSDQKYKGCCGLQLADMQQPQSWIFQFILVGNNAPFCVASLYVAVLRTYPQTLTDLLQYRKQTV